MATDNPIVYKLKSRATPGPGCLFRINRPDIGMVGEGYIFDALIRSVTLYRKANAIPIGLGFELELEQAICAQHPDLCATDDPREPLQPRSLNLQDVLNGTRVSVSWVKSGFKVVDSAEAERRASICAGCKFNVLFTRGCAGSICGELRDILNQIVPHGTSRDDALHSCYLCGCFLAVSVWIPRDVQFNPMSEHTKIRFDTNAPEACWKRTPKA